MEFNYESINDKLYEIHSNLSGYWTSIGWDDHTATISYDLESGEECEVLIHIDGSYSVPQELIDEMNEI